MSVWKAKRVFLIGEIFTVCIFAAVVYMMVRLPVQYADPIVRAGNERKKGNVAANIKKYPLNESDFVKRLGSDISAEDAGQQKSVKPVMPVQTSYSMQKQIENMLKLKGTWVEKEPSESMAIIQINDKEKLYAVNDAIEGINSCKLAGIFHEEIKVSVGSKVYSVKITKVEPKASRTANTAMAGKTRPQPGTAATGRPSRYPTRGSSRFGMGRSSKSSSGVQRIRPNSYSVSRDKFEPYKKQPDKLFTEVSVKPHIAENGEPTGGYVITGMKDQALLNQIGLQPGDIVTRINGKNPIELVNIINTSTLRNVNIDFIRAGRSRRLNFTIKD